MAYSMWVLQRRGHLWRIDRSEAALQPRLTIKLESWMQMQGLKKHLFSPVHCAHSSPRVFARCFQNTDKNTSAHRRRRSGSEMTKIKSNCNKWKDECGWETAHYGSAALSCQSCQHITISLHYSLASCHSSRLTYINTQRTHTSTHAEHVPSRVQNVLEAGTKRK